MSYRKRIPKETTPIIGIDEGWKQIKELGLDRLEFMITNGLETFPQNDFIKIYTIAYNMCVQTGRDNHTSELYIRHGLTMTDYITRCVLPKLRSKDSLLNNFMLHVENHVIINTWNCKFFSYLDRIYTNFDKDNKLPLEEVGLNIFNTTVFDVVKKDLTGTLIEIINQDRNNELIDRDVVRSVLKYYQSVGLEIYTDDFERQYLLATGDYYKKITGIWIENCSVSVYMKNVELVLEEESIRSRTLLTAKESENKVQKIVENETVGLRANDLLLHEESGFISMLKKNEFDNIHRMFNLFLRIDVLDSMASMFNKYILNVVDSILSAANNKNDLKDVKDNDLNDDPQLIKDILDTHENFQTMTSDHFSDNMKFVNSLNNAFGDLMSRTVGKYHITELLCSFCDRLLRSGNAEKLSDIQTEVLLDKAVQLFLHIRDKDVFADFYKNQLAKRLLNQRSASQEMERLMVGKLKIKCGAQFTSKFEGMLNDLSIGLDTMKSFNTYFQEKNKTDKESNDKESNLDFTTHLLTLGHWPKYKEVNVNLPLAMVQCRDAYKEYYDYKTPGRRLHWMHSQGSVVIKCTFGVKSYDIQVTTLQACVLTAFCGEKTDMAKNEAVLFTQLQSLLNINEEFLKRTLHSLACGKYRLIKKIAADPADEKKAVIKTMDSFQVNPKFASPLRKFRIPMASLDEKSDIKKWKKTAHLRLMLLLYAS